MRLVRQLRKELGTSHGTVFRVARQFGYGTESVRAWGRQADIDDGLPAGTTTDDTGPDQALEQEMRELRRTNAILRSAWAFFAAELTAQRSDDRLHRCASLRVRSRAHLQCVAGGSVHV